MFFEVKILMEMSQLSMCLLLAFIALGQDIFGFC